MSLRIAVVGATGRMGRSVARVAAGSDEVEVVGGVASSALDTDEAAGAGYPRVVSPESAAEFLESADVLLDFSSPGALAGLLTTDDGAIRRPRALVVGTTGLAASDLQILDDVAADAPVVVAANFSVGVNLLFRLAERAARTLGADDFDVELVETHHRDKADAPSGTALELGRSVARGRGVPEGLADIRRDGRSGETGSRPTGEIGFHAVRGGGVAGEHRLLFLGDRERIELAHVAADRDVFAEGALLACRWAEGRDAGLYGMGDVLGLTREAG